MPKKQYGKRCGKSAFSAASNIWSRDHSSSPSEPCKQTAQLRPQSPRKPLEPLDRNGTFNGLATFDKRQRKAPTVTAIELNEKLDALSIDEISDKSRNVDKRPPSAWATSKSVHPADSWSDLAPPTVSNPTTYGNTTTSARPTVDQPGSSPPVDPYMAPLLSLCANKSSPIPFSTWSSQLSSFFTLVKIAEASFGEVYRMCLSSPRPGFSNTDESVLKIIALKPPPPNNNDGKSNVKKTKAQKEREHNMSAVQAVVSEVQLLQRMTAIPGFVNFRDMRVLKGRPAEPFISAWHEYNRRQTSADTKSQFPDPAKKSSYGDDQLWAVIEMQDAGTDLEKVRLPTVFHVWDVFWAVVIAVAKAEKECRFEHRDLHLGNICVRSLRSTDSYIDKTKIRHLGRKKLGYTDLEPTIIDYTFSRADMEGDGDDEEVAHQDMDLDEAIFMGDDEIDYQYAIYRFMHSAFFHSNPTVPYHKGAAAKADRSWRDYQPLTNLVWLHFVLHTLLKNLERWPSDDMDSTLAFMEDDTDVKTAKRRAKKLESTLKAVNDTLQIETLAGFAEAGLASAGDLIWLALEDKWLDEDDVIRV